MSLAIRLYCRPDNPEHVCGCINVDNTASIASYAKRFYVAVYYSTEKYVIT
jgi:hypothetical protein